MQTYFYGHESNIFKSFGIPRKSARNREQKVYYGRNMTNPATRYHFDEEIGSGGFASVRKGRDNDLDRTIAGKFLDPLLSAFGDRPEEIERFRREAKTLAKMSHPNIPAVYDVIFEPPTFLIICEFIDGKTLASLIEDEGPCQISECRTWFGQITSALEHAHSLGITHRDVKPSNIIITADRQSAYLVDFGIALSKEEITRLTSKGDWIGTPGYMSPEQERGFDIDWRADIYSLAVTLYESLVATDLPKGRYKAVSEINETLPPSVDDLIQECLAERDQRNIKPSDFRARLSGALAPKPLADVLAHGRLHEIAIALEDKTPDEFLRLPEGQRFIILEKVSDIVQSEDPRLGAAIENLLAILLEKAMRIPKEDYRTIVEPAVIWGFEEKMGESTADFKGSRRIRTSLERAAFAARGDALDVLRSEFVSYIQTKDLKKQDAWYLASARDVVTALLANQSLASGAQELREIYRKVNECQRSLQSERSW